MSKKEKAINFFQLLKNAISNYLFSDLQKVDVLVFNHSRSKLVENKLIDPYSYYLVKNLIRNNISFLEFESPHNGKHVREKKRYTRYLDGILILRNIKNIVTKTNINQKTKNTVERLSKELNDNTDNFLDIKKILINNTKQFIPTYSYYLKLLQRTKKNRN